MSKTNDSHALNLRKYVAVAISIIGIIGLGIAIYFLNQSGFFTATYPDEGLFTHQDTPAIPLGASGTWDELSVAQPSTVLVDGTYYLFYLGVGQRADGEGRQTGIGYATSPDGMTWTKSSNNPIFTANDADVSVIHNPEIVHHDEQWILYFSVNEVANEARTNPNGVAVMRAVTNDLSDPWLLDDEVVLQIGAVNSWDERALQVGSVFVDADDTFHMVYSGNQGLYSGSIGYATSADGIEWTIHNLASTNEAPYEFSDPVFMTQDGLWDSGDIWAGTVASVDNQLLMIYHGGPRNPRNESLGLGLATSEDGITWHRYPQNPIIALEGQYPQSPAFILQENGTALILYTRRSLGNNAATDIGISHGNLPIVIN